MKKKCKSNAHEAADYARRFPRGHWSLLGPASEKKRYGTYSDKADKSSEDMMLDFAETIHSLSRARERGKLQSKGGSMKTVPFNGSEHNVELILRQLSIYGAVADMCTEVSKDTMASGKPEAHAAQDPLETMEIPTNLLLPTLEPMNSDKWNLLQEYEQQFEQLSDAQKLSKLCSKAGLKKMSKEDNISSHLLQKDRAEWCIYAENIRCFVTIWDLEQEAGFVRIRKLAQSWTFTFVRLRQKIRGYSKHLVKNHGNFLNLNPAAITRKKWRRTCCVLKFWKFRAF